MLLKEKISKEFTKESLRDRVNPKTTGKFQRKVRNISLGIASGAGTTAALLPSGNAKIISAIVAGLFTFIGTIAHSDKSNK